MSDQPDASHAPYATPGALERVENRARDDRVALEKQVQRDITTLRELYDERFKARDEAVRLQAAEYARRLDVLNHAHEQAKEAQARTVPREMFEEYKASVARALEVERKDHQSWKDQVNKTITESQTSGRVWMAAIGLLVTLISLAIRFVR